MKKYFEHDRGVLYNADFLKNEIQDKTAKLIIADPPYFETKGEFDFIWKNFDEYLKDVDRWALECKRLLADNGSLFWFGPSKKIAYTQIILDRYFKLINNLVWEKAERDGLFGSTGQKQLRSFPNSTERILFYSNEWDISSGNLIVNKATIKSRDYIVEEITRSKGTVSLKEINKVLGSATNGGGVASSVLSKNKDENTFITKDHYVVLREWLNRENGGKYLRREYDDLRRPFNNLTESTEVIKVRFTPSEYNHPTVKPRLLADTLIETCSRKGDVVVIPFSGSGTEAERAAVLNRYFIAFELKEEYCLMTSDRIQNHTSQLRLDDLC